MQCRTTQRCGRQCAVGRGASEGHPAYTQIPGQTQECGQQGVHKCSSSIHSFITYWLNKTIHSNEPSPTHPSSLVRKSGGPDRDVARKNNLGFFLFGRFHWFWAHLYAFLIFYNRNRFILGRGLNPKTRLNKPMATATCLTIYLSLLYFCHAREDPNVITKDMPVFLLELTVVLPFFSTQGHNHRPQTNVDITTPAVSPSSSSSPSFQCPLQKSHARLHST